MAAIVWKNVVDIAGELATTPPPTQNAILEFVAAEVHEDTWGDQFKAGSCYLAAHLATFPKARGKGPVLSQNTGGIAQSYGSMLSAGALGMTSYGMEYLRRTRLLTETAFGLVT